MSAAEAATESAPCTWWDRHLVAPWLPEGRSGAFAVERFTVTRKEAEHANVIGAISGLGGARRQIRPGTYTRLVQGELVWMSDTPAEVLDHLSFIAEAHGAVLITGLGLGMVAHGVLAKLEEGLPVVRKVTVVEQNEHVVALVAPALRARFGARVEVVHADAYTWKPAKGTTYDCAWHDVWPEINADNLSAFARIRRNYRPFVPTKAQGCWAEETCRYQQRQWRKEERWMGAWKR